MPPRHEYVLNLSDYGAGNIALGATHQAMTSTKMRQLSADDSAALADLMHDAYQGTIDYDGETLEQARDEVAAYFAGRDARPIPECSWLCLVGQQIVAACLVGWWEARQSPLICYLMTRQAWKNHGLGTALLQESLQSLADEGYTQVRAVVTEGNVPSELIFERAGFRRVGSA